MLGAIAGDIIGSIYEARPIKSKDFPLFGPGCRFTDDTVLTVAVAEAILSGTTYGECLRRFGRRHPRAGYGASFHAWLQAEDPQPYNSWGNGAAMRVSPVGFAFDTVDDVPVQVVAEELPESQRIRIQLHEGGSGPQALLRRNDRVYVVALSDDDGVFLGGARMPNLPPSVAAGSPAPHPTARGEAGSKRRPKTQLASWGRGRR
mgnify:CR=1 FL=1